MDCNQIRQDVLHRDWTAADLQAARAMLAHLDACADCRRAIGEYDQLRETLDGHEQNADPAPAGGWAAFEGRLTAQMKSPARHTWWRISAAMAAGVALLLAGYGLATMARDASGSGLGTGSGGSVAAQPLPEVRFTEQDASAHAAAFRQVTDVFGGRAQWVMVSDRASDVGVAQRSLGPTRDIFLVRLALTHDGRPAATSDVAIIPGQSADLRVPLEGGQSVRYRIGTTDAAQSRLAIWAELTGANGEAEPIAALTTQLKVAPGQSTRAGEMNTVSGPYRLSVAFAQAELPAKDAAR
jgi:hypothetical protein